MKFPIAGLLALGLAACEAPKSSTNPYAAAPDPNERPPELPAPKPWTTRFEGAGVFVAQRVRIEGPAGLLDHCVLRQELEVLDFDTKTTNEGLVQTARVRAGLTGVEVRAHLDNWTIVGLSEITVIERPGPVDVVVSGTGEAFLEEKGVERPQRGGALRVVGTIDRTVPAHAR